MKRVFFDIETIPGGIPDLDEVKVPSNYKDEEKILKYKEDNIEKEFRKRAVITHKSQVICIAWAVDNEEIQVVAGTDEETVIRTFINDLVGRETDKRELYSAEFVGHNVMFDLKTIVQRLFKYNIPVLALTELNSYSHRVRDTMRMFTLGDRQDLVSLDDVCTFFGIENKSMHGSEVYDYYILGDIDTITEYCKGDVQRVREVFGKLTFYEWLWTL